MDSCNHIQIDLQKVLRERLPRHSRFIPRWVVAWLERFICQEEMNRMLRSTAGLRGADFCRGVLAHLGISYIVNGDENLPDTPQKRRAIYVCNHPLGGLDGMTLIDMLTNRLGCEVRFLVNDLLMAVEPLTDLFLPVNKHGRQGRSVTTSLEEAMESDMPIIVFPAGLVSRKQPDGTIADLEWQKMFVNRAIKHKRDIIPIHFSGQNSSFFYNFARLRLKSGLKFNIEMLRLPAEVFRCRDTRFTISVGRSIAWQSLCGGPNAHAEAQKIKDIVYKLPQQ